MDFIARSVLVAGFGFMYHGKGVARGLALGLAAGSVLNVDNLLHPPLINEGAAAVSLPVSINTKVINDAFVTVVVCLALIFQALDLDKLGR